MAINDLKSNPIQGTLTAQERLILRQFQALEPDGRAVLHKTAQLLHRARRFGQTQAQAQPFNPHSEQQQ